MTEMFEFIRVLPADIQNDALAFSFLEMGAKNFGGITSVETTLNNYAQKRDILIIVKNSTVTIGAIHLTMTEQEVGRVMTSVLLGGVRFNEWASDLRKFYYKLAKDNHCDRFMLMGRRGFKKYFTELKEIATVFGVMLTNINE